MTIIVNHFNILEVSLKLKMVSEYEPMFLLKIQTYQSPLSGTVLTMGEMSYVICYYVFSIRMYKVMYAQFRYFQSRIEIQRYKEYNQNCWLKSVK